ncbi:MAG: hypothetical protein J7L77_00725 [Clostridiales bacterium]|nr:hypothetical protein [Clostridiales bacterium]
MKKKQYDDDDGRQIANMSDVQINTFGFGYIPKRRRPNVKFQENEKTNPNEYANVVPLTKKETRFMMIQAMLVSLGIAMIFIVGAALFILFCIYIWFR